MAKMAKWPQNGVKHAAQMRLRLLLLSSSFAHLAWLLFFMAFSLIDLSESDNRPSKQQALTRLSDPGNPTRPIDTPLALVLVLASPPHTTSSSTAAGVSQFYSNATHSN